MWSDKIKTIEKFGMTQAEIAEQVGCEQSYINHLRNGNRGKNIGLNIGLAINKLYRKVLRETRKKPAAIPSVANNEPG